MRFPALWPGRKYIMGPLWPWPRTPHWRVAAYREKAMTVHLNVRAHPNARREELRLIAPDTVEVWVRASAQAGRANEGIERAVSEAMAIRRSAVQIIRGAHGRAKV